MINRSSPSVGDLIVTTYANLHYVCREWTYRRGSGEQQSHSIDIEYSGKLSNCWSFDSPVEHRTTGNHIGESKA